MQWRRTACVAGRGEARIDVVCGARFSTLCLLISCSAQLYLGDNQIGNAGAAELAKLLAINRTLTWVC